MVTALIIGEGLMAVVAIFAILSFTSVKHEALKLQKELNDQANEALKPMVKSVSKLADVMTEVMVKELMS